MKVLTVKSTIGLCTNFCPNFEFAVKTLMNSNSLKLHNFKMKTDKNCENLAVN